MSYTATLPKVRDISWLSTLLPSYPVTRREIVRTARKWNLSNDLIAFLRQFDADVQFNSRSEFTLKCDTLAAKIRSEWESPRQTSII